jgi:hypothetical protein
LLALAEHDFIYPQRAGMQGGSHAGAPETWRRFMDFAAEREAKIDRQKQLDELESDFAPASIPIDRLNASNDD